MFWYIWIREYSWSFGDRSVFEKFELVRSEFCLFLLQPGQAFVNHSCQNHFSRITSTDRWSYLPFDMVLSAIRLNVAGSPTDWKDSSECKAHESRAYSPNFWRSNMPCSSVSYLFGCDYEKVQKISNSPLESAVTHSYRLQKMRPSFCSTFSFPCTQRTVRSCWCSTQTATVQKATMLWCMLRWFRSPASCSSAAWPHGGCSMGGASLEGTCG